MAHLQKSWEFRRDTAWSTGENMGKEEQYDTTALFVYFYLYFPFKYKCKFHQVWDLAYFVFFLLQLQQLPKFLKHGINIYWLNKQINHLLITQYPFNPLISFLSTQPLISFLSTPQCLLPRRVTSKLSFLCISVISLTDQKLSGKLDQCYGGQHRINVQECLPNLNSKVQNTPIR